ncbi:MAG: hypothetical protein CBD18_06750 [Opitutales bacterium TMED158]|nr:MAG: hypothetical protein CBD18_06750 [Opitutales bacterium TMED158]
MFGWLKRFGRRGKTSAEIGVSGEREAADLLKNKGYRIVARNWRAGRDEIDLICRDGEVLVFVETRTRARGALVGGYDSIDRKKRTALLRVCRAYLRKLKPKPRAFRLDVVEVEHKEGLVFEARHFENVPLFGKAAGRGL